MLPAVLVLVVLPVVIVLASVAVYHLSARGNGEDR